MSSNPDTICVIIHVDLAPNATARGVQPPPASPQEVRAAVIGGGVAQLAELTAAAREAPGCVSIEALQEVWRANHFSVVSVWRDLAAFEAFEATDRVRRVREALQPNLGAPWDVRFHHPLP